MENRSCLISGNTLVLKPASNTPLTNLVLASILNEAGFRQVCSISLQALVRLWEKAWLGARRLKKSPLPEK
nr:aldehyde dehydrogenase family protein [Methanosarcina barkeri]